ncbi:MAG: YceI family protein [Gemmatimonadales bacterium]|nr:MAG: YceI family protein [Gemmatimonadales bacterium]
MAGLLGVAGLFGVPASAAAQTYFADDGYVEFVSRAPLLEFKGVSNTLTGFVDLEAGTVDFFIDLETLDTDNRRRDRDMRRNYLETARYPFAEFMGEIRSSFDPGSLGDTPVQVVGRFTMREISRDLEVTGSVTREGDGLRLRASWTLELSDFDIDRPRVVFYELSDTQVVNIDILLRPGAPPGSS